MERLEKMTREEIDRRLYKMRLFWDSMADFEHDGFYGRADNCGRPDSGADKGTILMCRILWFYSNLYLLFHDDSLDLVKHAYQFIRTRSMDPIYGGVLESVHADGSAADAAKNIYTQSFCMLALASCFRATGDKDAREMVFSLHRLINDRYRLERGYRETLDKKPVPAFSLGTLIQLLEAYTEIFRAEPSQEIRDTLERLLKLFDEYFYDPGSGLLWEYDRHETGEDQNMFSYGHNAMAVLLSDRAEECLCNGMNAVKKTGGSVPEQVIRALYEKAFDPETGTLYYDSTGNRNRIWWAQADGAAAFFHAYRKSGEILYKEAAESILGFADSYMTDKRTGEWIEACLPYSTERPDQDLVHAWKGPYHTGRMYFELRKEM